MHRIVSLTLFASLAACTTASDPGTSSGMLVAGEAAQAFDVAGYVVDQDSVRIVGRDHRDVGTLMMARTAVDAVYISLDNERGHLFDNELTGPAADGWLRVQAGAAHMADAVESDPALAPFFAREKVAFVSASLLRTTDGLAPADVTTCSSNAVPLCNGASGCWESYGCSQSSGSGWSQTQRTCECPNVQCGSGFIYDTILRIRTCYDPGTNTCSNANYVQCTW